MTLLNILLYYFMFHILVDISKNKWNLIFQKMQTHYNLLELN